MHTAIRTTSSASEAEEWALVLVAAGIPHRVDRGAGGFTVLVPEAEAMRARATLDGYVEETLDRTIAVPPGRGSARAGWAVGGAVGALLLAWFAVTGQPAPGSRWFERGMGSARAILGGEPWRAVTSLTLHADAVHVLANAIATTVLLGAVVQQVGPGIGLWLVLLAGVIGNVLAALAHDPGHVWVGASTATFGAVAILAALRLSPAPGTTTTGSRRWTAVAASVLLLAMLGAGPRADVLGHVLGFAAGAALGLAARVARWPLAAWIDVALVALAALAVVASWLLALAGNNLIGVCVVLA